ncbi:MAG: N-acetylmuramoyl-L-alanine amidase [Candidatus Paceibacterota bacterium]
MKQTFFVTGFLFFILLGYHTLSEANARNPLIVKVSDIIGTVFLADAVSEKDLHTRYRLANEGKRKIRILIVPGHTPENPGTSYHSLPEWELTIKTALLLKRYLEADRLFEVSITQDTKGFTEAFRNYFEKERENIVDFINQKKSTMAYLMNRGVVNENQTVDHISVTQNIALELYGINRWANEHDIDIVLHLHFNDYPGRYKDSSPQHSGFSLYVPEKQYSNFKASRAIASYLFMSLNEYYPTSDLPLEKDIIIEDQDLIAIGAFNTLQSAVTLIEYGYIYEPQFVYKETQLPALADLAYQTYRGLKHYFEEDIHTTLPSTTHLPYTWKKNLRLGDKGKKDVLALQIYLTSEGLYPPTGKSRNDCPISGIFGVCTKTSLQEFQHERGIMPPSGYFGPQTRSVINVTEREE